MVKKKQYYEQKGVKKIKTKTVVRVPLPFFKDCDFVRALIVFIVFLRVLTCSRVLINMGKRNRISWNEKIKILDDCKEGTSPKEISIQYGIPKSSICTLKKLKPKL